MALFRAGTAFAAYLDPRKSLPAKSALMLKLTHHLVLWMPTGELMACVPISDNIQLPPDTIRLLLDNPVAYEGALAVYAVALTDDPDDLPPGSDAVYAGLGLPGGRAAAWTPV